MELGILERAGNSTERSTRVNCVEHLAFLRVTARGMGKADDSGADSPIIG